MHHPSRLLATLALVSFASAAPLSLTLTAPRPAPPETFHLGAARAPDGQTLTVDARSFRLNGQPWTPVMGEFHYTRYPAAEWREELLKMKAGGIDIVATYVFWIHHEEVEGTWDWSGDRNLRQFVQTAAELGLKVIVRCGPWCHGEVRNGGLPDWLVARGQVRTEDPAFLAATASLYGQIAGQLQGLLWKDGGPVVGIQVDNEYEGPAEYLLHLKSLARAAGLDVPVYTRTGWPALTTPMPFGEILPLYGVYAEGFWDRELTAMPGKYWTGFHFSKLRSDANIANEALGRRDAQDAPDVVRYPYLTCEIGGGMVSSYHRRIVVDPHDVAATTLVKLGSGSNSPGYYMYHGGTNPVGKLTTLMEQQSTALTNWNDMPVRNYDFQAPLGQYGQIRPQYHLLRRLHLFLHNFGAEFAGMDPVLPAQRPAGPEDTATLRWAVRSDGLGGFVFVNNFERRRKMPAKDGVQFAFRLADGSSLTFPAAPVSVPAGADFFWPFNLDLGPGVQLAWATAQPLCHLDDGAVRTWFFAKSDGVAAEFALRPASQVTALAGRPEVKDAQVLVHDVHPGRTVALRVGAGVQIVLLDAADSLALWQGRWQGRERVFLTGAGLVIDGDKLRLSSPHPADLKVAVCPALDPAAPELFQPLAAPAPKTYVGKVVTARIQAAGPPRKIVLGQAAQPVAAEPSDADFAAAAVWRIKLPADLDLATDPLLRIDYHGDVARVLIGGKLITDDFYNGQPLEIGLRRHAAALQDGELTIAILPLQKSAPIYYPEEIRYDFAKQDNIAELGRVTIVPRYTVELAGSP